MAYFLISPRGQRVARFSDFRVAKYHQMLAFVRGVEYSIEENPIQEACSFPQCYFPCQHCKAHIKPVEVQLDEQIFSRDTAVLV